MDDVIDLNYWPNTSFIKWTYIP